MKIDLNVKRIHLLKSNVGVSIHVWCRLTAAGSVNAREPAGGFIRRLMNTARKTVKNTIRLGL